MMRKTSLPSMEFESVGSGGGGGGRGMGGLRNIFRLHRDIGDSMVEAYGCSLFVRTIWLVRLEFEMDLFHEIFPQIQHNNV